MKSDEECVRFTCRLQKHVNAIPRRKQLISDPTDQTCKGAGRWGIQISTPGATPSWSAGGAGARPFGCGGFRWPRNWDCEQDARGGRGSGHGPRVASARRGTGFLPYWLQLQLRSRSAGVRIQTIVHWDQGGRDGMAIWPSQPRNCQSRNGINGGTYAGARDRDRPARGLLQLPIANTPVPFS